MNGDLEHELVRWCSAPHVSARSMLVTILGDTIVPLVDEVWLSDLFMLCEPFGFSERLVRTSLFRLGTEGWVTNCRVGRRSKYTPTDLAVRECRDAARRIYRRPGTDWDSGWTLVFLDQPVPRPTDREMFAKHLRWQGFVKLGRGLYASPVASVRDVHALVDHLALATTPAVATAHFDDLARLVRDGMFADAFHLSDFEQEYERFLDRYRPLLGRGFAPKLAYGLRTILVHDHRRVRLRLPDIPAELIPDGWIGGEAYALAAQLYRELTGPSTRFLSDVLAVDWAARTPVGFEA